MSMTAKLYHWNQFSESEEIELQRRAELLKPPAKNPPHLLIPTRVKVLRTFMVNGRPVATGETVTLPWHDAQSMIGLKKAQRLP